MKRIIVAATLLAMAGANLQTAKAGDDGWATAGKILTGVVAGAVIVSALDSPPAYASVTYTYGAPVRTYCPPPPPPRVVVVPAPVVCAPSPVIVYRTPGCAAPQPVASVTFGQYRDNCGKHCNHYSKRRGHDDDWKRYHRR